MTDKPMTNRAATKQHWEELYSEGKKWSGNVNASLARALEEAQIKPAGVALDLGAGEGADTIFLARQGFDATGVEISETAIERARENAAGVDAEFIQADLEDFQPPAADLISACFLHSRVDLDREKILRRAAAAIKPGGHIIIVSHAAPPPWSHHHDEHDLPTIDEEIATADLGNWEIKIADKWDKAVEYPEKAVLTDLVVVARKPLK